MRAAARFPAMYPQDDQHWVMSGFHDYAQEPLTWNSTIREALYQYAVGAITRAEFDFRLTGLPPTSWLM